MRAQQNTAKANTERDADAMNFLAERLPILDLTQLANNGELLPAVQVLAEPNGGLSEDACDCMAKILYRRSQRHVLLTGPKGVGKSTVIWELVRRAALRQYGFLAGHRFLWVDCSNVGIEDSRACLETILMAASSVPNLVLCLDGIAALLKRPLGGTNKPMLRAAASRTQLQIIGVLSRWEFNDLFGSDADMLEIFARVELPEPPEATALEIARHGAARLEADYKLTIGKELVERAVSLSSHFILNQSHPAKALRVLQRACDAVDYARTELRQQATMVTAASLLQVVSETTGIPESTLAGDTQVADYASTISEAVVGQGDAVQAVANELTLIRAGLNEPGKPASVMLFAGM